MNCIFCKVVKGEIPSKKIYEDQDVLGIIDITPQAPTHYLFLPKEHHESLATLPAKKIDLMAKIFAAIKSVTDKEGFSERGYRTVINTNREGGQTVFHLHVHMMAGRPMGGNMTGA